MLARVREAEHVVATSTFLFGLVASGVGYLHSTPLPPQWAGAAFVVGGIIRGLDYLMDQWKKRLPAGNL